MHSASEYLDLSHAPAPVTFDEAAPVWEILGRIGALFDALEDAPRIAGDVSPAAHLGDRVWVGKGTVVEAGATIQGPAWIGENCTVRAGAYLRANVIAGEKVMMGNSCEFKNCILFDQAEAPHFNYVGDSLLGHRAHLGAGAILSNVRLDRGTIQVRSRDEEGAGIDTGLGKFGSVIGDGAEIGCNSVLSPGSLLGRNCLLYPGTQWRGVLPANQIVKLRQQHLISTRH
ncbi:MAG: UDP-N-acetylglucosamine diphosphorylase [Verrucomicrobiales bacterium]